MNKRVLTCDGETISLAPKATEILVLLVLNAGQLIEKDELLKQVWPNTFVEEANLSQNIFILRRALGDERAAPSYIETVVRRGYRFIGAVRTVAVAENKRVTDDHQTNGRHVIAVLPFVNATHDQELEYLADGVTDNIINNLARVSKLRVMSRSAVFRHKTKDVDAQQAAEDLGANVVLVGRINSRPSGIAIAVELVEASTGWQLWGQSFDSDKDILQIQEAITRQVLRVLKLELTHDEEKRVTARYTENPQAYQSYLEGRYHWSRFTRKGIEKAIGHFRHAIEIDPNYALAYSAIVDCYLRLATNYLPPEDDVRRFAGSHAESADRVKLRFEWDWKSVERELRRANELKASYPSPHQWYFAYRTSKQLYKESRSGIPSREPLTTRVASDSRLASQIPSAQLTATEEVQILCSVARDQIAVGNFEAANLILRRWCVPGKWPRLDSLNPYAAADLLLTLGTLLGCIAGTKQVVRGHKQAEGFLAGSVALFEQLGVKSRSVEAQMELARCYYRQGLFELARETISDTLSVLPDDQIELRTLGLVTWGMIERESGRLRDSLSKLREAASLEAAGHLVTCRCFHDLATTLKELAISERNESHSQEAKLHFLRALHESEALGHHRYVAAGENNLGFFLLGLGAYEKSEKHLLRSRRLFESLSDSVRGAQVDETLARLYIETKQHTLAKMAIERAVETLELTDNEAFLAEALTTNGVVASRLGLPADAKRKFEAAYKVAERCGDNEGAGRALLCMFEELGDGLEHAEKLVMSEKMQSLFAKTQQSALLIRVEKIVSDVAAE